MYIVGYVRLFADSSDEPTLPPEQRMLSHDSTPQAVYVTFIHL